MAVMGLSGHSEQVVPLIKLLTVTKKVAPLPVTVPATRTRTHSAVLLHSSIRRTGAGAKIVATQKGIRVSCPTRRVQTASTRTGCCDGRHHVILDNGILIGRRNDALQTRIIACLVSRKQFITVPAPGRRMRAQCLLPPSRPTSTTDNSSTHPPTTHPPVLLSIDPIRSTPRSTPLSG